MRLSSRSLLKILVWWGGWNKPPACALQQCSEYIPARCFDLRTTFTFRKRFGSLPTHMQKTKNHSGEWHLLFWWGTLERYGTIVKLSSIFDAQVNQQYLTITNKLPVPGLVLHS